MVGVHQQGWMYWSGHDKVWLATGREIARYFNDHYYDAFAKASHPVHDL